MPQQLNLVSVLKNTTSFQITQVAIPSEGQAYPGPLYAVFERQYMLADQVNNVTMHIYGGGDTTQHSTFNCYHIPDISGATTTALIYDGFTPLQIESLSKNFISSVDVTGIISGDFSSGIYDVNITLPMKNDYNQHLNYGLTRGSRMSLVKFNTNYTFTNPNLYFKFGTFTGSINVKDQVKDFIKYFGNLSHLAYFTINYNSINVDRDTVIYPVNEVLQHHDSSINQIPRIYWKFNLPPINGTVKYAYLQFRSNPSMEFVNNIGKSPFKTYVSSNNNWTDLNTFDDGDFETMFNNSTQTQFTQIGASAYGGQLLMDAGEWTTVDVLGYPDHDDSVYNSVRGVRWAYDNDATGFTVILEYQSGQVSLAWSDNDDDGNFGHNLASTIRFGWNAFDVYLDGMNNPNSIKPRILLGYYSPIINVTPTTFTKTVTTDDTTTSAHTFTVTNDGDGVLNFTISNVSAPWIDSVTADTLGPLANGDSATVTITYDLSADYTGGYTSTTEFQINSPEANIVVVPITVNFNVAAYPHFIYNGDTTSEVFITLDKNPAVTNPTTTFGLFQGGYADYPTIFATVIIPYYTPPNPNDPPATFNTFTPTYPHPDFPQVGAYVTGNYLSTPAFSDPSPYDMQITEHVMSYDVSDLVVGETYRRGLALWYYSSFPYATLPVPRDILWFNIEVIDSTTPPIPKRKNSGTYSNYLI